jgi:hypothetical protein
MHVLPSSLLNEINALSLGETVLLIIIFLSNHTLQYNLLHRNQIHFQCIYYTIFFCFSIIDQLVPIGNINNSANEVFELSLKETYLFVVLIVSSFIKMFFFFNSIKVKRKINEQKKILVEIINKSNLE